MTNSNQSVVNALTIDVEDYFMVSAFEDVIQIKDWNTFESRVEANTNSILDLLDIYRIKATFFVLGWVAEKQPHIVKEIHKRGHETACHGYSHQLVYSLTTSEFRNDIVRAKKLLEDLTGERVLGYRAPSYSITKKSLWALDVLIEEGFSYDSSIFPIHHDRYGYQGFGRNPVKIDRVGVGSIFEIPLSTIRILGKNIPIAGGGYLRLLPIRFIEFGIKRLNKKEAVPAIIYFHPWEIDPLQPRMCGKRISVFRHYVHLDKTVLKIKRLLECFQFAPIRDVFATYLKAINSNLERVQ